MIHGATELLSGLQVKPMPDHSGLASCSRTSIDHAPDRSPPRPSHRCAALRPRLGSRPMEHCRMHTLMRAGPARRRIPNRRRAEQGRSISGTSDSRLPPTYYVTKARGSPLAFLSRHRRDGSLKRSSSGASLVEQMSPAGEKNSEVPGWAPHGIAWLGMQVALDGEGIRLVSRRRHQRRHFMPAA